MSANHKIDEAKAARVLKEMEEEGILDAPRAPQGWLKPLTRKRGALKRFLETRELARLLGFSV